MRLLPLPYIVTAAMVTSVIVGGAEASRPTPLPEASVRFEQNATDADVEVVFDISGAAEGLARLIITSPDGRTVVDFNAPDRSTLGIRSFQFESPEPRDVEALKAAYPTGSYTFSATTVSGQQLHGAATLTHELPPTAAFGHPAEDAEGVPSGALEIRWSAVAGLATCIVEVQEEEGDANILAVLPGSARSFRIPEGFLNAGKEYQLSIGTTNDAGNISFVETSFTTGPAN